MANFPTNKWVVVEGALKTVPGGGGVDLVTTEQFTDFEFEYEWKVSPAGNSGVMYRVAEINGPSYMTGPEMQVLDDAKHPDGKNPKTAAGSLYALLPPGPNRQVNPVGEWNKARIRFKNNQVEQWLNGVKVVEYTWGSPEITEAIRNSKFKDWQQFMKQDRGHIAIQHHGEEVWYRNLRVRPL
jgi:hypothetical protein